jgi:hypothetical protein
MSTSEQPRFPLCSLAKMWRYRKLRSRFGIVSELFLCCR